MAYSYLKTLFLLMFVSMISLETGFQLYSAGSNNTDSSLLHDRGIIDYEYINIWLDYFECADYILEAGRGNVTYYHIAYLFSLVNSSSKVILNIYSPSEDLYGSFEIVEGRIERIPISKGDLGLYRVEICSTHSRAYVEGFIYVSGFNNPFDFLDDRGGQPVGIIEYGVYLDPDSGSFRSYQRVYKRLMAIAVIDSFNVYYNYRGLSLQLNFYARYIDGESQHYLWFQNVVKLANLSSSNGVGVVRVSVGVNMFNLTNPLCAHISNGSIDGRGRLFEYKLQRCPEGEYVYIYYDLFREFIEVDLSELPLVILQTAEVVGNKVMLGFGMVGYLGYRVFDVVEVKPADRLDIVVEGNGSLLQLPIDLEYVVGGPSGSFPIAHLSEGSGIRLYLLVDRGYGWEVPYSAWSVGGSTFEGAANISIKPVEYGVELNSGGGSIPQIQLWIGGDTDPLTTKPSIAYLYIDGRVKQTLLLGEPERIIPVNSSFRYVLVDADTSSWGPLEIARLFYSAEKFYRFRILTINGSVVKQAKPLLSNGSIATEGWYAEAPAINRVLYRGLEVEAVEVRVNGSNIDVVAGLVDRSILARDLLGLPVPVADVYLVCGGEPLYLGTSDWSGSLYSRIPVDRECVVSTQPLGFYSIALILASVPAIFVVLVLLRRKAR